MKPFLHLMFGLILAFVFAVVTLAIADLVLGNKMWALVGVVGWYVWFFYAISTENPRPKWLCRALWITD